MGRAILPLLFLCVIISLSAFRFSLKQRSGKTLVAFAKVHELDMYGDELPTDFPIALIDRLPSHKIRDCVSGMRNGERVVCFDYALNRDVISIGSRNTRRKRATAVALKRAHWDAPQLSSYGDAVECGAWLMIGVGLQSGDSVLAAWDPLKTTSAVEESELERSQRSAPNLIIRPRHETWAKRQGRA